MSNPRIRRRTLIINYPLQMRLILHTVLVAMVTALTVHLGELHQAVSEISILGVGVVSTELVRWLPLPILGILMIWGFSITNRIAGPIYNLERHIKKILAGETTEPVHCRNSDYFKDLYSLVNKLAAARVAGKSEKTEK